MNLEARAQFLIGQSNGESLTLRSMSALRGHSHRPSAPATAHRIAALTPETYGQISKISPKNITFA